MLQGHTTQQSGRLIVICGCMFSGKTARLIDRLSAARRAERRVVACKHQLDNRYDPLRLITHDWRSFNATPVSSASEILACSTGFEVIGIDEAQFFGRDLTLVCQMLAAGRRTVIVAGIDHDAWGQPFPPLPELKAAADEVELLHVPCTICGQPARLSQRMVPVTDETMVGGLGEYEPRCQTCFEPLPTPAPEYK